MIDKSDCHDFGVDTTSGTKVHQTLPWGRGWLARLPEGMVNTSNYSCIHSSMMGSLHGPINFVLQLIPSHHGANSNLD